MKYKDIKYSLTVRNISKFFALTRSMISVKRKNNIAQSFYNEKLTFVIFYNLKHVLTKKIGFKKFIRTLKVVYAQNLIKGYSQIMKFKSKLPLGKREHFFYQKYREIVLHKITNRFIIEKFSHLFFKNLKYLKKKKIKKSKKNNIMQNYYHRKLLLTSLCAFVNYFKYRKIKNNFNSLQLRMSIGNILKMKSYKYNLELIKRKHYSIVKLKYLREMFLIILSRLLAQKISKPSIHSYSALRCLLKNRALNKLDASLKLILYVISKYLTKLTVCFYEMKKSYNVTLLERKLNTYYISKFVSTMKSIRETKQKYRLKLDQIKQQITGEQIKNQDI